MRMSEKEFNLIEENCKSKEMVPFLDLLEEEAFSDNVDAMSILADVYTMRALSHLDIIPALRCAVQLYSVICNEDSIKKLCHLIEENIVDISEVYELRLDPKFIESDNPWFQYLKGLIVASNKHGHRKTKSNRESEALDLIKKAYNGNVLPAGCLLAQWSLQGYGLMEKNIDESINILNKCIAYPRAKVMLANIYKQLGKPTEEYIWLYQKAAREGNTEAKIVLELTGTGHGKATR